MVRPFVLALFAGSVLIVGCSGSADSGRSSSNSTDAAGSGATEARKAKLPDVATPPTTDFVTLTDPVEHAYTIGMPKGWLNRTYVANDHGVYSMVDTTVSPDGSVLIFAGDPSLPQYYSPDGATPMHYEIAKTWKKMKIEYFTPAEDYFPGYVKRKFGKLPDFKLVSAGPDEENTAKLQEKFDNAGVNMRGTMARVKFTYTEGGKTMNAMIEGACCDSGPFWLVTVTGISTVGSPEDYLDMIDAMARTRVMSQQWQAEQQQKHEAQMAQIAEFGRQMTERHNQTMAWIQRSAEAHQQRMQAIWSANDASVQAFNDRMAAGDVQQQRFLNYINDENTVVTSSGQTMQVDNSYQRYYVNKNDNTYVGADITMDQDKLRSLGLNPDDYSEAKIKP
jgi:hypothetical protein